MKLYFPLVMFRSIVERNIFSFLLITVVVVGGKVEKRYSVFFLPLIMFIRADLLVERICLVVSGLVLKSVGVSPMVIGL